MLHREAFGQFVTSTSYGKDTGLFTEHYGYDGLGRLIWTEQDTPTTTHDWVTDETTSSLTAIQHAALRPHVARDAR